jgi:hypothetical protein
MPHRGLRDRAFQRLMDGIAYGMVLLNMSRTTPAYPLSNHTPKQWTRNKQIRARYANGEKLSRLADVFGLSPQRISQIIRGRRR